MLIIEKLLDADILDRLQKVFQFLKGKPDYEEQMVLLLEDIRDILIDIKDILENQKF